MPELDQDQENIRLANTPSRRSPSDSFFDSAPVAARRVTTETLSQSRMWWLSMRFRAASGSTIEPHRSMATVAVSRWDLFVSALLALAMTTIWFFCINSCTALWAKSIALGLKFLGLDANVTRIEIAVGLPWETLRILVPQVGVESSTPNISQWLTTLFGVIVLFVGAQLMGKRDLPVAYLLRWVALVQITALLFFAFYPSYYPYTLPQYLSGLLSANLVLISLTPAILALTYYIFDFPIWKKIALTLCVMGHLLIFAPLQLMLHSAIIHSMSLLWMPMLHLLFGIALSVLVMVSLYAWGMSWHEREGARQ